MNSKFTHFDNSGNAIMVDVSEKIKLKELQLQFQK